MPTATPVTATSAVDGSDTTAHVAHCASDYATNSVGSVVHNLMASGRCTADPRHFQIFALAGLLVYGVGWLGFEISAAQIVVTLSTCLATQWLLSKRPWRTLADWFKRLRAQTMQQRTGAGTFEPASAIISALSLCLLLRVDGLHYAALAAALAIASKFTLRWRGTHLFNPTAFAISVLLLGTDTVWISAGQWGHAALLMLTLAGLGLLVLTRAQRLDIALAFALTWTAITLSRAWWLHDPLSIAVHQLSNGAVVLFCLFMLTDPRTTPRHRRSRVLFAIVVAAFGAAINVNLYRSDGLILALVLCAPLTVLLNTLADLPRRRTARARCHQSFDNRRPS